MNMYIPIILLFILILIIVYICVIFRYNKKYYMGGTNTNTKNITKNIKIESIPCISNNLLIDMLNIIKHRHHSNTNYNAMTDDDIKFYERQSHILANKYNLDFNNTHMQLCSVRSMEIQIYMAQCSHKVATLSKTIKEDFEKGFDLTLIADKHKLPYILTLKQLCSSFGHSPKEIKRFLRKEKPFPKELDAINSELDYILKSDTTSSINSENARTRATEFEGQIDNILKKLNIKYYTENDLREKYNLANLANLANLDNLDNLDNKKSGGKKKKTAEKTEDVDEDISQENLITPDFLFHENESITLNEFPIKWIEVKNYVYYKHKFMEKNIQNQAKKYYNKYGNGIFIFKCGVICDHAHADVTPNVKFIGWHSS